MSSPAPSSDQPFRVSSDTARTFVERVMSRLAVPQDDARVIAAALVRADLRGVESHGVRRLPIYVERLRRGLVNPAPELRAHRLSAAMATLDGQNGFGFVSATRAMDEALEMAETSIIGSVLVSRSTHFGMAANYALQAVERDRIGLVFTNASPGIAPWGSRSALLGTSPLAVGSPGGVLGPFVLDMSPAVAARGRIRRAQQLGAHIPVDWALDADGRPTTDPSAALQGVLLPVGAHKGSGLSMLMDILCGVLTGAAFAGGVGDMYRDLERPQNVGHLLIAIRPDACVSMEEYRQRMDTLVGRVHALEPAAGFDEVVVPGELERREEVRRRTDGIPFSDEQLEELRTVAEAVGVLPPLAEATAGSA